MTTRRSRLKAVANLPVRRKVAVSQENGEALAASEKGVSAIKLSSDIKEKNIDPVGKCTEYQKVDSISQIGNKNENDDDSSSKNEKTVSNNTDNENNTHSGISLQASVRNKLFLKKGNENIKSLNENVKTNQTLSVRCKKKVIPNLNSSRSKEIINDEDSKKASTTTGSVISESIENCDINENDDAGEVNNFGALPVIPSATTSFTSRLTDSSLANVIVVTSSNYNEVQNNSILQPKKLINDLAINESSNNNEPASESDLCEPVLTPLVNFSLDNDSCTVGHVVNCSVSDSEVVSQNNTQTLSLNDSYIDGTVIEIMNYPDNDGISRSIVNPSEEKDLLDNFLYQQKMDMVSPNVNNESSIIHSPKKNLASLKRKRLKSSNFTKKLADAKREFQKKFEKTKPDRSTLKMIDLIFYNPTTNPMESKMKQAKNPLVSSELIQETLMDEDADEPQSIECDSNFQSQNVSETNLRMPVPQVKIGLNGEIILDEKSIIIESTDAKKGREDLFKNSIPIFEDRETKVSYYRGKTKKTKDWTDSETKRFYKALNTIGPDFSLMQKYFPKRSRMELKNKFKREERLNRSLVDRALINPSEFDMTQLEKDLAVEKIAEEKELEVKLNKTVKEKQCTRRSRIKSSLFSKEIKDCNEIKENNQILVSEAHNQEMFKDENEKKNKEIGCILRKYLLRDIKKD